MLQRTIFSEEHNIFREQVRKWVEKEITPHADAWEKAGQIPREVYKKAGAQGYLCSWIEETYGGMGADWLYSVIVMEEIAKSGNSGVAFALHSDVVVPYLHAFGSEEQKKKWLPGCVDGSIITAIAMTEPGTGSDLAAIQTTATDKGDHWVINGSKTFISNGLISNLVIVVAKTGNDPANPHGNHSLFVVEEGAKGFERGRKLDKIGMKAQDTSELYFNDCVIPKANILGDVGAGFYYLMQKLQQERLVVALGAAVGMEMAVAETIKYTKERKAFGKPLSKLQNTRFKLVESHGKAVIARVYVDRLIEAHMRGENIVAETSIAKYWVTDALCEVVDECLQLHGGFGYMREYPIAKAYEDARVQRIYAGANEIMKEIVAKVELGL